MHYYPATKKTRKQIANRNNMGTPYEVPDWPETLEEEEEEKKTWHKHHLQIGFKVASIK